MKTINNSIEKQAQDINMHFREEIQMTSTYVKRC